VYSLIVPRWRKLSLAASLTVYFTYFAWDGLKAHFAPDEPMNMYAGWHPTPLEFWLSHLTIWRGEYRPMGGVFYRLLFDTFGWNPVPYHAALLLLLLAGVFLVFRFARLLGCGELTAALTALIVCYHAGLSLLYYDTAFVYDALCGLFYLAALVFYVRIRARDRQLTIRETAVFLALYLCALNSKEMAVTLPAVLLAYEWIYREPPRWSWLRGPGRVILLAAALNLAYIYGRTLAPDALARDPGYRVVFSWKRLADFQNRTLRDLFLGWNSFDKHTPLAIWVTVTYLAWRRNRPALRFCWFYILLTPLPIEFLPGRGGPCLYIPLFGWATFASIVFRDVVRAAAAFGAREPLLRALGRSRISALLIATGLFLWARDNRRLENSFVKPSIPRLGQQTWEVMQQFQSVRPRVEPGSRVVFLDDPLGTFDMAFLAELWFRDRSVSVSLNRRAPLPPAEIAAANHVFTFQNQKLVQLR
jgi:hypothetical protein